MALEVMTPPALSFMKMPEVAELLQISVTQAYRLAREGELPGVLRVGGSVRINREVLLNWLGEQVGQ